MRRFLPLLWAAGGLAACQKPAALYPTADSAIERLREQASCSRAVQGEAALSFSGEGRRLNGRVMYLAARPESLRLDVVSPFGVTISTLTSDGRRFGLSSLEDKTFFFGPATTCNVERFTRVPVPPFALVELLRGQAPILRHDSARAEVSYRPQLLGSGYYHVEIQGAHDAVQRLRLGVHPDDFDRPLREQRLRLLRVEVSQEGRPLYEVDLSAHAPAQSAPIQRTAEEIALDLPAPVPSGPPCEAELPRKVRFYVPDTGHELTFQTEEVWHNPPLGAEVFRQAVPGGLHLQESLCSD